jgi:single-strand DNA-binding protein
VGGDPELRVTPSGQSVLKLRIATTESYLDRNNTRQERTEWHSISIWGKRGEALSKIIAKGDRLLIAGRIRTSTYEKNGEKRYRTEIIAQDVFLSGSRRTNPAQQQPTSQPQRPPPKPAPPQPAQGEEPYYGTDPGADDDIPF